MLVRELEERDADVQADVIEALIQHPVRNPGLRFSDGRGRSRDLSPLSGKPASSSSSSSPSGKDSPEGRRWPASTRSPGPDAETDLRLAQPRLSPRGRDAGLSELPRRDEEVGGLRARASREYPGKDIKDALLALARGAAPGRKSPDLPQDSQDAEKFEGTNNKRFPAASPGNR